MPHILQNESNETGTGRRGALSVVPWPTNISKSLSVAGPVPWKTKVNTTPRRRIRIQTRTRACDANRVNGMLRGPSHERLRPGRGPKVKAPGESYRPLHKTFSLFRRHMPRAHARKKERGVIKLN